MLFPSIKPDEMDIIENRIANWKKVIDINLKKLSMRPEL